MSLSSLMILMAKSGDELYSCKKNRVKRTINDFLISLPSKYTLTENDVSKGFDLCNSVESMVCQLRYLYQQEKIAAGEMTREAYNEIEQKCTDFQEIAQKSIGNVLEAEENDFKAACAELEAMFSPLMEDQEEDFENSVNSIDKMAELVAERAEKNKDVSRDEAYRISFEDVCAEKRITNEAARYLLQRDVDVFKSMNQLDSGLQQMAEILKEVVQVHS